MGIFVRHEPCPKCGSKDNFAVYDDKSGHCFGCQYTVPSQEYIESKKEERPNRVKPYRKEPMEQIEAVKSTKPPITDEENTKVKSETSTKTHGYRGLKEETTKLFGVRHAFDADGNVIEQYYPCTQEGQLVGYKVREEPKNFFSIGRTGADVELFMQFKFNRGGKYVLLVEGELDALSAYQMLSEYNKSRGSDFETAVVSATIGANAKKQIAAQYKFFDSFENVILCMDNDSAGNKAEEELLKYLPKGKVKIMPRRFKDANEYLTKGQQKEFIADFYNAKKQVPVGVLPSDQLYERMLNQAAVAKVPFPPFMQELNDMFVGGLPLGHIVNIAADTGIGKCFAKGTKIRMFDMSIKNVEDVRNGDLVMGDDGTARRVSGVTSGFDKLYEVKQVKGMSYVVNSAHILSLRATTDIKTLKLKKGDVLNINIEEYLKLPKTYQQYLKGYKADISNYGEGDVLHSYLIGLWLGDGTSTKPQITFGKTEVELIDWFNDYVSKQGWTTNVSSSNDRDGCITVDIRGFRETLNEYNLLQNKHIPCKIFQASLDTRLKCLAGIIDADGYLASNCYSLTMKNNQLASDIATLARSVGLAVTEKEVFKKCQNFAGDIYKSITISGNIDKIPVLLSKRKASSRKQIKNVLNTGISVKELGVDEYFGFQVDGNHLFCLEDFTVTHNTTLVNELIKFWVFNSPHLVGIVSMELDAGQYGEVLLSQHIGKKLSLIGSTEDKLEYIKSDRVKAMADELFKNGDEPRFYLLDNRDGSIEEIQDTVEELVVACGCKIIVLDPLQDILDGLTNEEQAVFMKWMKGFIKSHGVTFVLINHMRKTPAGQNGADSEQNIMGSSTIIKSASGNILLKRDKMAEDPVVRNTTEILVSKNRICGLTGPAGAVYYNNETHRLQSLKSFLEGQPSD